MGGLFRVSRTTHEVVAIEFGCVHMRRSAQSKPAQDARRVVAVPYIPGAVSTTFGVRHLSISLAGDHKDAKGLQKEQVVEDLLRDILGNQILYFKLISRTNDLETAFPKGQVVGHPPVSLDCTQTLKRFLAASSFPKSSACNS